MEDQLKTIVTRIDSSRLDSQDKDKIYKMIVAGLQSIVLPVLIKYMPKDQLKDLSNHPTKITVETYIKLIDDTLQDGHALEEIQTHMNRLLQEVDVTLKEAGI